jgi:AcrR family transcriptional regulator
MPRRSAKEAAETRRKIVDAAKSLFAEKGFADTSIAAIVKHAGVTDGALFHHFKDKKTLFAEIVEKLHAEIHREIFAAGKNATSAREAFSIGGRASMRITRMKAYQRIVFIDAPAVLGTQDWRSLDAALGLKLIEDNLHAIAGTFDLPPEILKPMSYMALGTINELTYAQIRTEKDVDFELCLKLLDEALDYWITSKVEPWKAENGIS